MVHKTLGCANCKKRKLKCDLSRPGCQRCRRIGKDCPGYPDDWDLAFRSENAIVYAKVQKKQTAVSGYIEREPSSSLRSHSPRNDLSDNIEQHAICLFFCDYIIHSCPGICDGFLDYLPDLYGRYSEDSGLRQAVLAAAYANIAQKTRRKDLELEATSFYHDSLQKVKHNISKPQLATSDINMTAVILLGLYEGINNGSIINSSFEHTKGLSVLADLRGSSLHGKGPTLLQIACCQVNRKNIEFGLFPSPADERLHNLLDSTSRTSRLILNMFNASIFSANAYHDIQSGIPERIWNTSVLHHFKKLENDNEQWESDARIAIPYQTTTCIVGDHPQSEGQKHHIYRGFWSETLWNKHRSVIITLSQALLARLDVAKSSSRDEDFETNDIIELRYKVTREIQIMVRDILASIAFSVGDIPSQFTVGMPKSVGGYFLIWTLKVILRCPVASEEQRDLARAALLRIGRQFGISYALKSAQVYMGMVDSPLPANSGRRPHLTVSRDSISDSDGVKWAAPPLEALRAVRVS